MSSELVRVETTTLPLAEIASKLYNIDEHLFENMYLGFSELSVAAQKLLTDAGLYPIATVPPTPTTPESTTPSVTVTDEEHYAFYQQQLGALRKARLERLGRTLEGVNRALIYGLVANHPALHAQFAAAFATGSSADKTSVPIDMAQLLPSLQGVLVPELQSHLDAYMEEIDALLWFEVTLRKTTSSGNAQRAAMTKREVKAAREAEVQRMTAFVLRRLQRANEKVQEEMKAAAKARAAIGKGDGEGALLLEQGMGEGHISDGDESDFDFEGEDLGFWTGAKVVGEPLGAGLDGRKEQTVN